MPSSAPSRRGTRDHEATWFPDRRYTGLLGGAGLPGPAVVGGLGPALQRDGGAAVPGANGLDARLVSEGVSGGAGDATAGDLGRNRSADAVRVRGRHGSLPHGSGIS